MDSIMYAGIVIGAIAFVISMRMGVRATQEFKDRFPETAPQGSRPWFRLDAGSSPQDKTLPESIKGKYLLAQLFTFIFIVIGFLESYYFKWQFGVILFFFPLLLALIGGVKTLLSLVRRV